MVLATSEKDVCGFIEFELIKLAERINVSGNMNMEQIAFIASQLVGMFPNETIADFKLCFEKGAMGAYGKIFKLDGVEIGKWMTGVREGNKIITPGYLDEKYQVIENELMKEKDEHFKKPLQNTDWTQVWKESIEKTDSEGGVKTTSQNMHFLNRLRGLTPEETRTQGQEKPAHKPYPVTALSEAKAHALHLEYCRQNFDKYTGDRLSTWVTEQEWIESLSHDVIKSIYKQANIK